MRLPTLLLCAVLAPLAAAPQDLPEIKKTGKLRVLAVAISEGPQFMSRGGAEPGMDAEMLAAFAKLHGLTVEPVFITAWDALTPSLRKGTSMSAALAAAGVKQVDDAIPPGGVPAALREGRAIAAVDGLESALVAARHDPDLQIGLFVGSAQSLAYAVRKESPKLLAALNEYIGNLRRTPSWNRLVVKYFGAAAPDILRRSRQ